MKLKVTPAVAAESARERTQAARSRAKAQGKSAKAPPPLPPDHVSGSIPTHRSFQDRQMLANTLDLIEHTGKLFAELDLDRNGRLNPSELKRLPVIPDETPEARFGRMVLQQKLSRHLSLIDLRGDGLDSQDIERLRQNVFRPEAQVRTLVAVPLREPALVDSIAPRPPSAPYLLRSAGEREHGFEGRYQPHGAEARLEHRSLPAEVHLLVIGESQVELLLPMAEEQRVGLPAPEDLAKAIAMLPLALRQHLKMIELSPLPYRFEVGGTVNAHEADMSAGPGGKVTVYPNLARRDEEIFRTLVHELGHLLSFSHWGQETSGPGWEGWHAAMRADDLAPSRYARINASAPGMEDFAEALTAWVMSRNQPEHADWRELMPARFAMLDALLAQAVDAAEPAKGENQ